MHVLKLTILGIYGSSKCLLPHEHPGSKWENMVAFATIATTNFEPCNNMPNPRIRALLKSHKSASSIHLCASIRAVSSSLYSGSNANPNTWRDSMLFYCQMFRFCNSPYQSLTCLRQCRSGGVSYQHQTRHETIWFLIGQSFSNLLLWWLLSDDGICAKFERSSFVYETSWTI